MELLDVFKALGDENRLRIFYLLIQGELCVCEIEAILDITQSNASRHLNKLKQAGLIESYKKAQWVYYKIKKSFVEENVDFYNYLTKNLIIEKDLMRLNSYNNSDLDCNCIKKNMNKVMNYLNDFGG